jgi:hypothetical protein
MISSAPLVSCPLFLDFVAAEPGTYEADDHCRWDRLSSLFYAGQEVLTQIRLMQERQEKERQQRC